MSMAVVKALRGRLDFYFQRGRQIVRAWPAKSNLHPTPGQKIQRDNFRAIECCLKRQGPQQRAAWQAWPPGVGQSWVDYVHRVWMPAAANQTLFACPDLLATIQEGLGPESRYLLLTWQLDDPNQPRPFDVMLSTPAPVSRRWTWTVQDYKIQRGRFRQPRWTPATTGARRVPPTIFNPETGHAIFPLPDGTESACFAVLASDEPDTRALLSACQHVAR